VALPESSVFSTWLYDRLRAFLMRPPGAYRGPEYRPRRKGLVVTICILASVLLWFTFAMRETYTRILEFPTEIRNLPADEALADLPPRTVRAQVEGEGIQLIRLYYDPPVIPIDAARGTVDLDVLAPDVVKNVRLDAVTPRTVTVYKESRVQRMLPVRSRLSVATPAGHYVIGPVVLDPDSVLVSGAGSIVRGLSSWPTAAARITADDDTLNASVSLSDTLSGLVDVGDEAVSVRGRVREFTEATRVVDVLVLDAPPGQQVSLEPATVRVTFQVPLEQYDAAMTAGDFWAAVPYAAIRSDTTGSVVPVPHLPAGIVVRQLRLDPPALRYFDVLE